MSNYPSNHEIMTCVKIIGEYKERELMNYTCLGIYDFALIATS